MFCLEYQLPNYFSSEIAKHIVENIPTHLLNQKTEQYKNPYSDNFSFKKEVHFPLVNIILN
jgi:hypothetical protein